MGVRVKMEINDEVSEVLMRLGAKSPEILENVLFGTSLAGKKKVIGSMRRVLTERTGQMRKGVKFKRTSKNRFVLKGPPLGSVYEFNGAEIFPKKSGGLLRWMSEGEWKSSNWISIEPRPFFYSSMRKFVESGEMNKVMIERIGYEIEKAGIDI